MGTCMARCWPPPFLDPRSYQPVRSRYLPDQDTIQVTDVSSTQSCSTGSSTSLYEVNLNGHEGDDDDDDDDDEKLLIPNIDEDGDGDVHPIFTNLSTTSDIEDYCSRIEDDDDDKLLIPSEDEEVDTNPQFSKLSNSDTEPFGENPYYSLVQVEAEDDLELTTPQHHRMRRSTMRSVTLGSILSLNEAESPVTNSIDLEWEPEAGLRNCGQISPAEREPSTQLSASHTADTGSWVPRSGCSTPNSLEWDFRASTLSLRGAENEGGLHQQQRHQQEAETEQLLFEIEQLAARALADTGHGLAPDATNQMDLTNR